MEPLLIQKAVEFIIYLILFTLILFSASIRCDVNPRRYPRQHVFGNCNYESSPADTSPYTSTVCIFAADACHFRHGTATHEMLPYTATLNRISKALPMPLFCPLFLRATLFFVFKAVFSKSIRPRKTRDPNRSVPYS